MQHIKAVKVMSSFKAGKLNQELSVDVVCFLEDIWEGFISLLCLTAVMPNKYASYPRT